jgi:hypothetical protein
MVQSAVHRRGALDGTRRGLPLHLALHESKAEGPARCCEARDRVDVAGGTTGVVGQCHGCATDGMDVGDHASTCQARTDPASAGAPPTAAEIITRLRARKITLTYEPETRSLQTDTSPEVKIIIGRGADRRGAAVST